MQKEEQNEFEDYTEKLIPIRVTITRQKGHITYVFDVDGFRGSETGKIYYKGKDMLAIERYLKGVIRIQVLSHTGLMLSFETPQTVTGSATSVINLLNIKSEKTNFYQRAQ